MRDRISTQNARGQGSALARARHKRYVDELMDDYVSWHEACAEVAVAYENWRHAEREDREIAFGGYVAALDREEQAARIYQGAIARLAAA
jgi:hypothetical protein